MFKDHIFIHETQWGGTGGTDEIDDTDVEPRYRVFRSCDLTKGDIIGRYMRAVKNLSKQVDDFKGGEVWEMYSFEPCLIAKGVTADILEELPTHVGDKYAKCVVNDGDLLITDLSTGGAHGAGVVEIVGQAREWSKLVFDIRCGATIKANNGQSGFAPDLVIQVAGNQLLAGVPHAHLIIIELEVSNRSIRQMRQDYLQYFQFDPSVYSVVAIKMLPGDKYTPCGRAFAVQWTRLPAGGVVEAVGQWDFGLLGVSRGTGTMLSEQLDAALPPVPSASWLPHRYAPVPMATLSEPPYALPHNASDRATDAAAGRFVFDLSPRDVSTTLYGGVSPCVPFDRQVLSMSRHNVPPGEPKIQDFVLDLGRVSYVTQRTAPPL